MIEVRNTIDAHGEVDYCVECRDSTERWVEIHIHSGRGTHALVVLCSEHAFKLAYKLMAKASEA